ncbi:unnamed protein product [Strongylus vulgaris]|uniref:Uncharacterized protein n=1 Tax=Strongylus vulgaris TaxID=40348 RepID=A0A3P7KHI9_STRVU|nr:unnamed protein product [Strongylus vulgaris]
MDLDLANAAAAVHTNTVSDANEGKKRMETTWGPARQDRPSKYLGQPAPFRPLRPIVIPPQYCPCSASAPFSEKHMIVLGPEKDINPMRATDICFLTVSR